MLPEAGVRATQITETVSRVMYEDLRPFSIVDNPGFRNLLHVLEPRYETPSRVHFSGKVIPAKYARAKENLQTQIEGQTLLLLRVFYC